MFVIHSNSSYDFWLFSILIVKFADIAFKLYLIQKIDTTKNNEIDIIKSILPLDIKITMVIRYTNAVVYPLSYIFFLLIL